LIEGLEESTADLSVEFECPLGRSMVALGSGSYTRVVISFLLSRMDVSWPLTSRQASGKKTAIATHNA
jgi:hypothetical protein